MRLLIAALLTFMLVALCQGRSMRYPRQGASVTTLENGSLEKSSEESGIDDGDDDPDWVPTDEDDDVDDPDWVPTDEDDDVDDPDWVPTDEDYDADYNDYEYDEEGFDRGTRQANTAALKPEFGATTLEDSDDDVVNDPDWVPTAEDYEYTYDDNLEYDRNEDGDNDDIDGDEDGDNDDIDSDDNGDSRNGDDPDDTLWSSDDDPDWKPAEAGDDDDNDEYDEEGFDRGTRQANTAALKPDFGATALEDSDDDVVNDPDWVPTAEDYEYTYDDDNLEYDSNDDGDNDDIDGDEDGDNDDIDSDDDGDSRNGDDPDDTLWSSDDDPDWKPAEAGDDEDDVDESTEKEDEVTRLDVVLFDIAIIMAESADLNVTGPHKVLEVFKTLKELNLTYEQAVQVLSTLETVGDTSENEIVTEAPRANESPVATVIQSKRQVKSHRISQDINQDRFQAQPIQAIGDIQESLPDQYNEDIESTYDGVYDQGTWGSGQINQVGSVNQASQGNQQDIAEGVEPYNPQGVNPNEVGSGIEPLDRDSGNAGSSGSNWLVRGWGHVVDTADKVGDRFEDTFSDWGDKIAGAVDKVQDVASGAVDSARDAAQSAGESIVNTYHKVKGQIPELLGRIRSLFTRFGVLVQTGAEYYIQQMEGAVDKVRQAEILDKLQQKLADGNEQVTAFFQTLGEKASTWTQNHGHENVDAGLITIQQVHPDEGVVGEDIVQVGGQQTMPNWFQDEEVIEQLNQIMNSGILEQSDLDVLSQQKDQEEAAAAATQTGAQQQQNQQQNQQQQSPTSSPVIQIQSSGSRRSLRALIDALMVH